MTDTYKNMSHKYGRLNTWKTGAQTWRLIHDFQTPFCIVPNKFETDGASVPRVLWWFVSPATRFFEAAVIHDYLLSHGDKGRKYANYAFYRAALDHGAPKWKAYLAYTAVRIYTALKS